MNLRKRREKEKAERKRTETINAMNRNSIRKEARTTNHGCMSKTAPFLWEIMCVFDQFVKSLKAKTNTRGKIDN
jgi:hypothetical protein